MRGRYRASISYGLRAVSRHFAWECQKFRVWAVVAGSSRRCPGVGGSFLDGPVSQRSITFSYRSHSAANTWYPPMASIEPSILRLATSASIKGVRQSAKRSRGPWTRQGSRERR